MKKRITYTINSEQIEVPDIVNEKCNAAYEAIRQEAHQNPRKIHHKKKAAVIAIAAAAAIACSGTVAATYFRSAYNFISKETYTKNPEEKIDLSAFAKPVNDEKTQSAANITMQSVYCDGENLSAAFALTPNNEDLKRMTGIQANIITKLNGKNINLPQEDWNKINFTADENGTFYGVVSYQNLDITDAVKLEISISNMIGSNYKLQIWRPDRPGDYYGSGSYEPEMIGGFDDDKFDFETTVKADTSNNKLYEINETQDGITLENVYITPFKTVVSINGLSERQQIRIIDQDGNEIEYMHVYAGEEWEYRFVPPLKTSKQLSVQVWDVDMDDFPTLYEFTFDIEKGFVDKYDVKYDTEDIVYDPPLEEMNRHEEEDYNKMISAQVKAAEKVEKLPVNTPVSEEITRDETMYEEKPETMAVSWKITGSEIGDVIDDNISDEEWESLTTRYGATSENAKMLFVTYELTNTTNKTGNIYWLGAYIYSEDFKVCLGEPDYQSQKDNGGKSSYKYELEANETRTITLGYIVPEEYSDKEFYAVNYDGADELTANSLLNGTVKLMEIK